MAPNASKIEQIPSPELNHIILESLRSPALTPMNSFYDEGFRHVIQEVFKVNREVTQTHDPNASKIGYEIIFSDTKMGTPMTINGTTQTPLYPTEARDKCVDYNAPVMVNIDIKLTQHWKDTTREPLVKTAKIARHHLCNFPVMVGSNRCNTGPHAVSKENLASVGEDPDDMSNPFLFAGSEYVVQTAAEPEFNRTQTIKGKEHNGILTYQSILSRPGDGLQNSGRTLIEVHKSGAIYFTLDREPFKFRIPFFAALSIYGLNSHRQACETIAEGTHDELGAAIHQFALDAMDPSLYGNRWNVQPATPTTIDTINAIIMNNKETLRMWVNRNNNSGGGALSEIQIKELYQRTVKSFDDFALPHIGNSGARSEKARFICHQVRLAIMHHTEAIETDSRDSYTSRRLITAGVTISKTLKSAFNLAVLSAVRTAVTEFARSKPFSEIDATKIFPARATSALTQAIAKAFTTTNTLTDVVVAKTGTTSNRMPTARMYPASSTFAAKVNRDVSQASSTAQQSKGSVRATEIRSIAQSMIHGICTTNTPEGQSSGLRLQLAASSRITDGGSIFLTRKALTEMYEVIPVESVPLNAIRGGAALAYTLAEIQGFDKVPKEDPKPKPLTRLFSGGVMIGFVRKHSTFMAKLRTMRRNGSAFTIETSFHYVPKEDSIYVCTDYGRVMFPAFPVVNNGADWRSGKWRQWPVIDTIPGAREMNIEQLVKLGGIEWITLQEQTNTFLGTLEKVREEPKAYLRPYTHCVLPSSQLGVPALCTPFQNMSQVTRNTFGANQTTQACGWPAQNWNKRMYKGVYIMSTIQQPIVQTLGERIVMPSGINAVVLVSPYRGSNQEDSLVINASAIANVGYYACANKRHLVPTNAKITTPTNSNCTGLRSGNVDKLVDGIVPAGTIVRDGDVLIGTIEPIITATGETTGYKGRGYKDSSLVYNGTPAYVQRVIRTLNPENGSATTIQVHLLTEGQIQQGDKFSSRAGQKGVCGAVVRYSNFPVTPDGMAPILIMNPLAYPSRMTVGQMLENALGVEGAIQGHFHDGSPFSSVTMEEVMERFDVIIADKNTHYEGDRHGYYPMLDGSTGRPIENALAMGITYYRRLDKVASGSAQIAHTVRRDPMTRQPVRGKIHQGGVRTGEMEVGTMSANGAMGAMTDSIDRCDSVMLYVCSKCDNQYSVANPDQNVYQCRTLNCTGGVPRAMPNRHAAFRVRESLGAAGIKFSIH